MRLGILTLFLVCSMAASAYAKTAIYNCEINEADRNTLVARATIEIGLYNFSRTDIIAVGFMTLYPGTRNAIAGRIEIVGGNKFFKNDYLRGELSNGFVKRAIGGIAYHGGIQFPNTSFQFDTITIDDRGPINWMNCTLSKSQM